MLISKCVIASVLFMTWASAQDLIATHMDDQQHSFTFANSYTQQLTGATVKVVRKIAGAQEATTTLIYDCFLNPGQPPLAPGQSYTWNIGDDSSPTTVVLDAAIFSDGKAQGSDEAVKSLWRRRTFLVGSFRELFSLLDQHPELLEDRAKAIDYLKSSQNIRTGPKAPIEERAAVRIAYGTFLANLQEFPTEKAQDVVQRVRTKAAERISSIEKQPTPSQLRY